MDVASGYLSKEGLASLEQAFHLAATPMRGKNAIAELLFTLLAVATLLAEMKLDADSHHSFIA